MLAGVRGVVILSGDSNVRALASPVNTVYYRCDS